MKLTAIVVSAMLAWISAVANAQPPPQPEQKATNERLGIRAGYAWTANNISENFGGGLDLNLHFTQRIIEPLYADVTLGAIYLGSTDSKITQEFFGTQFDNVSMRILKLTVAPMVQLPLNDRTEFYFAAGGGLYAVSLLIDETLNEFDLTNNNWGVNVNAGLTRRFFTNWFVDLDVYLHKFWTADELDVDNPDWFFLYSNGDPDPLFWAVTAGVMLRLF